MLIQNCFKGQRVVYKENGKPATILSVSHNKGEIVIAFDNAERLTVASSLLEPAGEGQAPARKPGGPSRPCPQCGTRMGVDETTCPECGFQYGVKKGGGSRGLVKAFLTIVVLAAIGYVVWKFVLQR